VAAIVVDVVAVHVAAVVGAAAAAAAAAAAVAVAVAVVVRIAAAAAVAATAVGAENVAAAWHWVAFQATVVDTGVADRFAFHEVEVAFGLDG